MAHILVVEDNDDVREELVFMLELEGHQVRWAGSGREALARVADALPDLVLCDVMMPEMDGHATLAALRADPATATLPFIFLTARAEKVDFRQGMERGADDYLTKPFTIEEVRGAVTAALAKRARNADSVERALASLREQVGASLPHELKTPLACILGYAEMLAEDETLRARPDVAAMAQHILDAGQRINRLTDNALLYMELELLRRGRGDASRLHAGAPLRVDELARHVARQRAIAYRREPDLVLDCEPTAVHVGESHAERLVGEIVDNAFKFSSNGTPVIVTTRTAGSRGALSVADRGCGMRADQIREIGAYVQFERLAHEQQGVGLGLAIAFRVATLWQGELTVESEPAYGTTVHVALPSAGEPTGKGTLAPT